MTSARVGPPPGRPPRASRGRRRRRAGRPAPPRPRPARVPPPAVPSGRGPCRATVALASGPRCVAAPRIACTGRGDAHRAAASMPGRRRRPRRRTGRRCAWPTIMCCHSGTGRCSETTTSVSPRTSPSQAPNSSALLTVADSDTTWTSWRQVDDDLLPHRAAEPVGEVVHLVHDDEAEAAQGGRPGIHHVAQHLGRHDDDRRLAVDRGVAGEQADLVGAVPRARGRRTSGWTAP